MRLNKWLSHNTHLSRREADALIKNGQVNIERKVANLGDCIEGGKSAPRVFIDGREIKPREAHKSGAQKFSVIVYHKPKNELVAKSDPRGRRVVFEGLEARFRHFLPVGRLDFSSSGLLLLTDSPLVATALMQSPLVRVYNLKLSGEVSPKCLEAMQNGITIDDATKGAHRLSKITKMTFAPFCFFENLGESSGGVRVKVGICEGQNRELRRFFGAFGLEVLELKRVSYGFASLNALPVGKTRFLNRREYAKLHSFLKETTPKNAREKNEKNERKNAANAARFAEKPRGFKGAGFADSGFAKGREDSHKRFAKSPREGRKNRGGEGGGRGSGESGGKPGANPNRDARQRWQKSQKKQP